MSQGRSYENPEKKAIEKDSCPAPSCSTAQNDAGTCTTEWHKTDTGCSAPVLAQSAPATDFKIADNHYRIASHLTACLTISDGDAWSGFTTSASSLLLDFERAALAEAALKSLPIEDALTVAREAMDVVGSPFPAFLGGMTDARVWADRATRAELKAYALASFEAMPSADQAAFLNHVNATQKEQAA